MDQGSLVLEALQPHNRPKADEIPRQSPDLAYNPFDVSTNGSTFDTSRPLDDNTVAPDSSLLYPHLYDTFFSELPINLPSSTDDMSNWNIFQADYEALLSNQPYDNQ